MKAFSLFSQSLDGLALEGTVVVVVFESANAAAGAPRARMAPKEPATMILAVRPRIATPFNTSGTSVIIDPVISL